MDEMIKSEYIRMRIIVSVINDGIFCFYSCAFLIFILYE